MTAKLMKWFLFLLPVLSALTGSMGQRVNRLIMPTTSSSLKLTPQFSMPYSMTSSVTSGMAMSLPIQMRFPSMLDLMTPVRLAMMGQNPQQSATQPAAASGGGTGGGSGTVAASNRMNSNSKFTKLSVVNNTRAEMRKNMYESIEKFHGNLGKACLRRAICEVAATPFLAPSTGLFGEIVDILLSTSHIKDHFGVLSEYRSAEKTGHSWMSGSAGKSTSTSCASRYKACPISLFSVIKMVDLM